MNPHFPTHHTPIVLYRNSLSGHCHRVELMLALLDLPYQSVDLDMANGEHKGSDYLRKNPFGQVPAIDDNGTTLADSNAIICYLAAQYGDGHPWMPSEPKYAAEVQRWLSVAAGEIASGPCAARLVTVFGAGLDHPLAIKKAHALFAVLEPLLAQQEYLVGNAITLADVAGYSYIAHAPEGGVSLEPYPAIRAWLARIEAQPRFVGMQRSPLPEATAN